MEGIRQYWQNSLSQRLSLQHSQSQEQTDINIQVIEPEENITNTFNTLSVRSHHRSMDTNFYSFTDEESYRATLKDYHFDFFKLFKKVFNVGIERNYEVECTNPKFGMPEMKDYLTRLAGDLTSPNNKPLKEAIKYLVNAIVCLENSDTYIVANENFGKVGKCAMEGYDKGKSNLSQKVIGTRLIIFSLIMRIAYNYELKNYTEFYNLPFYLLDMIGEKVLLMVDKLLTDIEDIKHSDNTSKNKIEPSLHSMNSILKFSFPISWITIRRVLIKPRNQSDLQYALNFIPDGKAGRAEVSLSRKLQLYLWKDYSKLGNTKDGQQTELYIYSELADTINLGQKEINNMADFFRALVTRSPDDIGKLGIVEMPFILNLCRDHENDMFIHKACKQDNIFWVRRFLSKRVVLEKGSDGKTLLHMACESGNLAMVLLLIEHSEQEAFEEMDNNMCTPIEYAADELDAYLINYLLEKVDETMTIFILIKLPIILRTMVVSESSDEETLDAVRNFISCVKRMRHDNMIYQEITKGVDWCDGCDLTIKPSTIQYIFSILAIWENQ